jgi:hypothetical protein
MNRDDRNRLAELRDQAELADLEIETMTASDFGKLNAATLTAGQIITLASLIEAFNTIRNAAPGLTGDIYATPATSERRSGPFSAYSDEADEAKRAEVKERLLNLLAGRFEPDQKIDTVNGPMRYADLPKDDNGNLPADWIEANCTCDEHERKRIEADRQSADIDPFAFRPGNYL